MNIQHHYAAVANAFMSEVRDVPKLARQTGFDGLMFDAFTPQLNLTELSATGRREFRHAVTAFEQQLVGLRVDLGMRGLSPGVDLDRVLHQISRVLDTAAGLMSPLVCIELGPLPEPASPPKPTKKISPDEAGLIIIPQSGAIEEAPATEAKKLDPAFAASVDTALVAMGELAERFSVVIAFRSELSSFGALQRAIAAARCPWFGVDLDPVSILRDEWSPDEIFSALGPLVRHVRARDAILGTERRTKPASIGRGDTKWDQLLNHLDETAYNGWITLDPMELNDRAAGLQSGLKFLRLHDA